MQPGVSLIVEMGTRRITGARSVADVLGRMRRAARGLPVSSYEIILVGDHVDSTRKGTRRLRWLREAGGYYRHKNTAAERARGEILVFWDSDCTPQPTYLAQALAHLERDPGLTGVTGLTFYDGSTWLTRLNTALSFGYLHAAEGGDCPVPALSHNLVVRRSCVEARPFGPHVGRTGGDLWVTARAAERGRPILLDPTLRIDHEDPSFSLSGLFERHLREHFSGLYRRRVVTRWSACVVSLRSVLRSPRVRSIKLARYGGHLGLTKLDRWLAMPVFGAYALGDALVVGVVAGVPALLDRWLRFQFGVDRATWTGPPPGVQAR